MIAQITASHFVAGIELRGDHVVDAAPIVRYMVGWDALRVADYCKSKHWHVERVREVAA